MNDWEAFTAARGERLRASDADLLPLVLKALDGWSASGNWYADLVEAASVLWLETFQAEAPKADPDLFIGRYTAMLEESLAKTSQPGEPGDRASQANRIAYWMSTFTANNATYWGNVAHGGDRMRWATMGDGSVRDTHRVANGQVAATDGTFNIGGFDLHYPGEPVGPPEIWINCRCLLVPARVKGQSMSNSITASGVIITAKGDVDGTVAMYGPFDTEENARAWLEHDGSAVTDPVIVALVDPDEVDAAMPLSEADEVPVPTGLPVDELDDGEEEVTEIPVHGVAAIEGRPTGDGRQFALGSVEFGAMPQPLGFEFESSHGGGNSKVAIIGRIDEFFKFEVDGYTEIRFRGVIHPGKAYAAQALEGIIDGSYGGLSVIVDSVSLDVAQTELSIESTADGEMPVETYSKLRIRRFDMVPTPAYQECFLNLGAEFANELDQECLDCVEASAQDDIGSFKVVDLSSLSDEEVAQYDALSPEEQDVYAEERSLIIASAFAPGTKDGPGWITHPIPTGRIRRYWTHGEGAAKIAWGTPGDFNRCRRQLAKYIANPEWLAGACANMHKEALGVWPGQEGGGRAGHALVAGAAPIRFESEASVIPMDAFSNPNLSGPTPITIVGDRIFGHLATWGVCHIGIQDACVTAPHSTTNYAFFRTGVVQTDGGPVPVGNITFGTGHAGGSLNMSKTVAHYDNTGTVVADVAAGDDAYGIWVAGILRPGLSDQTVAALAASALSGDWRRTANGLELVAALAVNVPGYPVLRPALFASADLGQESLVAAGVVTHEKAMEGKMAFSAEEVAGIVRTAVDEYRAAEDRARRIEAIRPIIEETRSHAVSRVTGFFQEGD